MTIKQGLDLGYTDMINTQQIHSQANYNQVNHKAILNYTDMHVVSSTLSHD